MKSSYHVALTALILGSGCLILPPSTAQAEAPDDVAAVEQQDSHWARALRAEEQYRQRHARLARLHELSLERGDETRAAEIEGLIDHMEKRHAKRMTIWRNRVGDQWREHLDRIDKEHVEHHAKAREAMRRARNGEQHEARSDRHQDRQARFVEKRQDRHDRFVDKHENRHDRLVDKHQDRHDRLVDKHQDRHDHLVDKHQDRHDRFVDKHQDRHDRFVDKHQDRAGDRAEQRQEWTSDRHQDRHDRIQSRWKLDGTTSERPGERRDARAGDKAAMMQKKHQKAGFRLSTRGEATTSAKEKITRENEDLIFRQLKAELERDM